MIIQQLQQQKMSSADVLSLEEFPHFKTEWQTTGNNFKHLYSSDLCELRLLRRVPVKELDFYSSREAYSFPFCPRIYKYNIERNQLIDSQIAFDIKLLLEYVPNRLSDQASNEQMKTKIIDILRAIEYLRQRFGHFRIKKGMIGWTALGIVKVWINSDFSANFVEEEASSEEEMLEDLFSIYPFCETFSILQEERLNSLSSMIEFMEENLITSFQLKSKKKALKQIQNFNNSEYSFDRHQQREAPETYSTKSRKNITFSYSNKDINSKPIHKFHNASKRSSIALVGDNFKNDSIEGFALLAPRKGLQFGNHHQQSSSLKMIHQKKTNQHHQKKMSVFRPVESQGDGVKIKRLSDYFAMTTHTNSENQVPRIGDIYRHSVQERPDYLHFSTSSNPYSKLATKDVKQPSQGVHLGQFEEHQHYQHDQSLSNDEKGATVEPISDLQRQLTEFTLAEKKQNCEQAEQLLKDDLDALFNSDHEFDYGELENELDHVLF